MVSLLENTSFIMLYVKSFTLGPLDTNCYLLWDESTQGRPAMLIDPADAGDFLTEEILNEQVSLTSIILTHGHIDHMMGATELSLNFGLPVWVHPKDQFLVDRSVSTAKHWFDQDILPPPATKPIEIGFPVTLGKYTIQILHTPGHTPGSVTLLLETQEKSQIYLNNTLLSDFTHVAIVGDIIFAQGYGRTDFSYANSKQLWSSLHMLQSTIPNTTLVLSGHGEIFTWAGRLQLP